MPVGGRLRPYLLLTLLCAVLYLPGIAALPPLDRDEARFAQASRQMVTSGDYVRIRFQDEARHKKPIGIHWLQAASVHLTGAAPDSIWAYRLPSAAGAWLAVLFTCAAGRRLFDARTGLVGAALLAATPLLAAEAHIAKTDAALLAAVVGAQAALARIYLAARTPGADSPGYAPALAFWIAQGLGILLKGPIAPAISLLTVLALGVADRDWRWLRHLRPAIGAPLAAAIAAPWFVAVHLATEGAFVGDAVAQDLLPKLISGQESHGAPPGTYLAAMLLSVWPASLVALPAVVHGWRRRGEPAVRFCLAWLIPGWLMFEIVPTKLPHYVLPVVPALMLLAAAALAGAIGQGRAATLASSLAGRAYTLLWLLATLGAAAGLAAAPLAVGGGLTWTTIAPGAVAAAGGAAALVLAWSRRWAAALTAALGVAVLVYPWMTQVAAPGLDRLWPSRELARTVADLQGDDGPPVAVAGYGEPSLVFLLGTDTRLLSAEAAAAYLARTPGAIAAVTAREAAAFRQALEERGTGAREVARIAGFDYVHGDPMTLVVYRAPNAAAEAAPTHLAAGIGRRQTAPP